MGSQPCLGGKEAKVWWCSDGGRRETVRGTKATIVALSRGRWVEQ